MYFTTFINKTSVDIVSLARSNPVIAIVVLIILAVFIYSKPLLVSFILLFCLLLLAVTYLIMGMSSPWPFKWNLP